MVCIVFWVLIVISVVFGVLFYIPFLQSHRSIRSFRIQYISGPLYKLIRKSLPHMSRTEKEAIEAGDVWLEGDLFRGRPDWKKLHALPVPSLSEEELSFLNNQVETLCQMVEDWTITHYDFDLPAKAWDYLKSERFFGMNIPKSFGGLGFSALGNSTIIQKLSTRSVTLAVTTMVPNSLGPAELLLAYGTSAQKDYYLPRLASGQEIPCFALTGPEAGSDASAIPDVGIVCRGIFEGKEVLGMRLTWNKRYITLAPIATVLGLAFKLYDPEGLLEESEKNEKNKKNENNESNEENQKNDKNRKNEKSLGITVCLLPTHLPGVEIGKRHFPLNQPFMNGPTRGKDVFVPLDFIIGGTPMIGKGWRMLVESLSAGRGISLPALSTAIGKMGFRTAGAYARIRKQFNTPIGRFEGVEATLARIGGLTYLLESCRLLTLSAIDNEIRPSVATAIAKYHMTEMGRIVINDAMDVHGGKGIMMGPNNYIGRNYESIPISITVEGANILTRSLIIFGQGAIRCHPFIQLEMQAGLKEDINEGIDLFDKAFCGHFKYFSSNMIRNLFHALTGGFFASFFCGFRGTRTPVLRSYYGAICRMSVSLAFVSDIALVLFGGKLKRLERSSARLGDVLSYLYLASCALKYFKDSNEKKSDRCFAIWALQTCLYRAQESLLEFFRNLPNPYIAFVLKWKVFPWGRPYALPKDSLEHQMVQAMMEPGDLRERLTQYIFVGRNGDNPVANLENAFLQLLSSEPALLKIEDAIKQGLLSKEMDSELKLQSAIKIGLLTEEEANIVREFEKARQKVIQVDEFTQQELAHLSNQSIQSNQPIKK